MTTEAPLPNTPTIQANAENISKESLDCGIKALGCCNGPGCQKLGTKRTFLAIFAVAGILQGAAETFFRISAKQAAIDHGYESVVLDWLLVSNGIFQGVFALVVTHWAQKFHRMGWLGGLIITEAFLCFLLIIPTVTFFAEENSLVDKTTTIDVCLTTSNNHLTFERTYGSTTLIFLFLTQCGIALGNIAFYTLGISYIDDNADSVDSPALIATAIGSKIWGSQLGSGLSLVVSSTPYGWWLGWTILCPLLLTFGIIITIFPRKLLKIVIKQAANRLIEETSPDLRSEPKLLEDTGFFASIKRIFTNKVLLFNILALVFIQVGTVNYILNEQSYLQARFFLPTNEGTGLLNEWTSRFLSHLLKPPVVGICILVAGLVIAKAKPSGSSLAMWNIAMGVLTGFLFISYIFVNCENGSIVGAYKGKILQPGCSRECICPSSIGFNPVCPINGGATYFSPCHAGCSKESSLNSIIIYEDCRCGMDHEIPISGGQATEGACNLQQCQKMWIIYQILTVFAAASLASAIVGKIIITLRVVLPQDKALALSTEMFLAGILVYIPGKLGYDAVSTNTCQYFSHDKSKCFLHETPLHGDLLNIISACLVIIGIIFDTLVLVFIKDVDCYKNENPTPYQAVPLRSMSPNGRYQGIVNDDDDNSSGEDLMTPPNTAIGINSTQNTENRFDFERPKALLTDQGVTYAQVVKSLQKRNDSSAQQDKSSPANPSSPSSPVSSYKSIIYADVEHGRPQDNGKDQIDFRMQAPVATAGSEKQSAAILLPGPSGNSSSTSIPVQSKPHRVAPSLILTKEKGKYDRPKTPETDF